MKTITAAARDLVLTAIDLTRSCGANELYFDWLALHSTALGGSAGIADYLAATALAFEDQARHYGPAAFDVFIARETFSDILMASTPLSAEELQKAVKIAIAEAQEEGAAPADMPSKHARGLTMTSSPKDQPQLRPGRRRRCDAPG